MATEQADAPGEGEEAPPDAAESNRVSVGDYSWVDYLEEHGFEEDAAAVRESRSRAGAGTGTAVDWESREADPASLLGFDPRETSDIIEGVAGPAKGLQDHFDRFLDLSRTPVVKDRYLWLHLQLEYHYEDGSRPRNAEGEVIPFDETRDEFLGFEKDDIEGALAHAAGNASNLEEVVDERTVNVNPEVDEDAFFSTVDGQTTIVNRYDLEKAVPIEKKTHFVEQERYWVNKPYAFVILFHSERENEKKYYVIEPYRNEIERNLEEFLTEKLRTAIKYSSDEVVVEGAEQERRNVIESEARRLLERYDLYEGPVARQRGIVDRLLAMVGQEDANVPDSDGVEGIKARPEPTVLAEDPDMLTPYQVQKLLYILKRDFIGYERIDPIKHDINVEDISCDGYNSPVFVYHTDHENIITNVIHGEQSLDEFVVKLAQRSGKGISKRQPQVDATLPDGSRAQLTLGEEVSGHGTNYTIRQFNDVPFTPIDLINWKTFSLEEMAFLWLSIENEKSLIFAGGTASGKTTSLNAVSLFIPSNSKIVSIEDTREVTLPQRNWVASVTRPSFSDDERGDIDEFDLLEAALRQRPDYIVMGEVRGEEGRTLFQVMSTGHTTYTTFHADTVGEVLKRFTTEPINVSKTLFTALDLVSIQAQTRIKGQKVRRNRVLTEINEYNAENDEINVQDVFQWIPERDEFQRQPASNTLDEIMFDRGWDRDTLESEIFKREVILAYLIDKGLNSYAEVAATAQAFINDPDTILSLVATDRLEASLEDLREMETVWIDIDPEKEELVPRPDPADGVLEQAQDILADAEDELFPEYREREADLLAALASVEPEEDVVVETPASELGPAGEETLSEAEREAQREEADTQTESEEDTEEPDAPEAAVSSPDAETESGESAPEASPESADPGADQTDTSDESDKSGTEESDAPEADSPDEGDENGFEGFETVSFEDEQESGGDSPDTSESDETDDGDGSETDE